MTSSIKVPGWGARAGRTAGLCMALAAAPLACADTPQGALGRADALIAQGDIDSAHSLLRAMAQRLEDADKADQHGAAHLQVLGRLAELNAGSLHNAPQAIADYSRLIRLDPQSDAAIAAQCRMADLYRDATGEPERAVSALRAAAAALGTRTTGAQVRQNLWGTLMAMGNYTAAYAEAQGVLERWPQSREASLARLTMGRADYMEGRYARAAATLEALMDDTQDGQIQAFAQIEAGNCYQELGELPRALTFYYLALEHHPNPAMVQDKIARVRERIYHMAPRDGILNASRPSRHIAAWQPRPTPQDLGIGP
jgi:tetratricopeptide (TPR) repeat protein